MVGKAFAVVILIFNRQEILWRTLEYIENQESLLSCEVIVIDDVLITRPPGLEFGKGQRVNWKLLKDERNLGCERVRRTECYLGQTFETADRNLSEDSQGGSIII